MSTAVLFYQCQLEEGDSLVGLSHYYQPIWRTPFLPGHWLLTTERGLSPVKWLPCLSQGPLLCTTLLSWPEGASCVKIKRDPGRKRPTCQYFVCQGLSYDVMMAANKTRHAKYVGVIYLDEPYLITKNAPLSTTQKCVQWVLQHPILWGHSKRPKIA